MKKVVTLAVGAAALAWAFAPMPASADYVASANTVALCMQTQASGYWRLTSNTLDVNWDWDWEWIPMNATGVTVTVKSETLGVDRTWSTSDTSVTNVVLTDLFAVGSGMNTGSPVVTLTFANANGTRSKSRTYDVFAGAFGHTDVRRGPIGSRSWKAIEYPLQIPPIRAGLNGDVCSLGMDEHRHRGRFDGQHLARHGALRLRPDSETESRIHGGPLFLVH